MNPMLCSPEKPWGIHPTVLSDQACSRCGWVAPGPIGDAREAAAEEAAEAAAEAAVSLPAWIVYDGAQARKALAA